jgi:hypothetical protein
MRPACNRLANFDCDHCADKGFGFQRQPTTRRLYKFPSSIGADGAAPLLFAGINPRKSDSNAELHDLITSDLNAFDQLSRNRLFGEAYIATNGREKHYRVHARIATAASESNGAPFENVAACTEAFLCATEDATPAIAACLRNGAGPCVERHFWNTIRRVQPKVVIAVGTLVCDFLSRYCIGSPPRVNTGDKPALLAIPHPSHRTLSFEECEEVGKICRTIISSEKDDQPISYRWDYRFAQRPQTTRTRNMIVSEIQWSPKYGWKPHHRVADLQWLEEDPARKIRYELIRDGKCRYQLELDARQLRRAIGKYVDGPNWERTGYTNPITISVGGRATEQLKPAWGGFARTVTP